MLTARFARLHGQGRPNYTRFPQRARRKLGGADFFRQTDVRARWRPTVRIDLPYFRLCALAEDLASRLTSLSAARPSRALLARFGAWAPDYRAVGLLRSPNRYNRLRVMRNAHSDAVASDGAPSLTSHTTTRVSSATAGSEVGGFASGFCSSGSSSSASFTA